MEISFLGFLISADGLKMDPSKIRAISEWPQSQSIKGVQCFLGLASFYRKFIKDFSTLAGPLTDCLKKGNFRWDTTQRDNFNILKTKLTQWPVLHLPDFTQPFEVAVDAFGIGIGAVLTQNQHPIEYFSEKLCQSRQNWSTYE